MAQWVKTLFENVATTAMPHQGPCLRGMDTGTRFSNRTQTIALAIRRFFSLNILKVSLFIIVWAFVQMYHNTGIRSAEDSFQKCGCRRQLRPSCLVAASTFTCWAVLLPHDTFFNGFWCKFYVFEEHMMGLDWWFLSWVPSPGLIVQFPHDLRCHLLPSVTPRYIAGLSGAHIFFIALLESLLLIHTL